jgi:DNA-binding transcriptional ArsR family regulator
VRVRIGAGTGVELLVATMAVADADWRVVFTHGSEVYDAALAAGGRSLARDAARIGRVGWTNLLGPLTRRRGIWSDAALRTTVAELPAAELRGLLVGRRSTGVAWLRRAEPSEVRRTCLRVLDAVPSPATRTPSVTTIRARLAAVGPEQLLDEVAPGLHYGPGVLADVVLVTSPQVVPIVVEVAEPDRTVIVHPPLGEAGATDAGARLRDLGRALGDATRIHVLQQLKGGERTLAELCAALDTPRTTLLHHLALLRGAGLVDLSVTAGEPNVYRLRAEGFDELGQAARAFPLQ